MEFPDLLVALATALEIAGADALRGNLVECFRMRVCLCEVSWLQASTAVRCKGGTGTGALDLRCISVEAEEGCENDTLDWEMKYRCKGSSLRSLL